MMSDFRGLGSFLLYIVGLSEPEARGRGSCPQLLASQLTLSVIECVGGQNLVHVVVE